MASSQKGTTLSKRTEDAFVSKGMSLNWKKAVETFREHSHSAAHVEAVEKLLLIKSNKSVISMLDHHAQENQLKARAALKVIATTILILAQTGSPLRGHTDNHSNLMCWLNRRAEDIPRLKDFISRRESFLSHDIQNELLSLMANDILRQVLADIKSSPYFSIMVDETTDISTKEQVSICVRMLKSDMQPTELFLGLYEVSSTTGKVLVNVITDALLRFDLLFSKLRGQCYDGASNMAGNIHGVQSRIKAIQPYARYVHCTAHNLNLVLQETAGLVPLIRDCLQYVHDTAILFGRIALSVKPSCRKPKGSCQQCAQLDGQCAQLVC
jgi:hypothetical protein